MGVEEWRKNFSETRKKVRNWGKWGEDDELGCLNYIEAAEKQKAGKCIVDGESYGLSMLLKTSNDVFARTTRNMTKLPLDQSETGVPNFVIDTWTHSHHGHYITHMDTTAHCYWEGQTYNGRRENIISNFDGALKCSTETLQNGIFTRGVLLDIAKSKKTELLDPGFEIMKEDLEETAKQQNIKIEKGDILLVRTGYGAIDKENDHRGCGGLNPNCAEFFHEHQISMIGTDTHGEATPAVDETCKMPTHILCLIDMGLPILDNANFEELSTICEKKQRYTFALSIAPILYQGGTGSPVNPLAIF